VKESDAKTSACKHPLNKFGHIKYAQQENTLQESKKQPKHCISHNHEKYLTYPGYETGLWNLLQKIGLAFTPRLRPPAARTTHDPPLPTSDLGEQQVAVFTMNKSCFLKACNSTPKRMQTWKSKYHLFKMALSLKQSVIVALPE